MNLSNYQFCSFVLIAGKPYGLNGMSKLQPLLESVYKIGIYFLSNKLIQLIV